MKRLEIDMYVAVSDKNSVHYELAYGEHRLEKTVFTATTNKNKLLLEGITEALQQIKLPCDIKVHTGSDYILKTSKTIRAKYETGFKIPMRNKSDWAELYQLGIQKKVRMKFL